MVAVLVFYRRLTGFQKAFAQYITIRTLVDQPYLHGSTQLSSKTEQTGRLEPFTTQTAQKVARREHVPHNTDI